MKNIVRKISDYAMSRRSFLKWTAAISATALMTGCEAELLEVSAEEVKNIKEERGEWVSAACWHNCGGQCLLKAHVTDGVVTRVKTDDMGNDTADMPQQRACARGRAQRKQVFGADRLKYPMVRSHWEVGGGQKELRGRDTWKRISWDQALDIVSSELKRVKTEYGNDSIYLINGGDMQRPLSLFGGYVQKHGSRSRGAWHKAMKPILGVSQKNHIINGRMDLLNANLIVLWGNNPAWSSAGMPMNNFLRAKEKGIKFICIDPYYTASASALADEFIPIRPATDTTMLLAIAHVLLTEDSPQNPLIDWDFLNRCTVGFDADHMPEGADPKENFKDYVLGTYDDQPKTPEWASDICGVPVDTIRSLALQIGMAKPATVLFGWNSARIEKGQHVCLAQTCVGAMTGNMGIKGGAFGISCQEPAANGGPALVKAGKDGIEAIKNPVKTKLCTNEHWHAILTNQYTAGRNEKKPIDIRMIYHSHSSTLNQTNNINKGIKAHRKVDFVVTHQYVLNPNAAYSDLVLPITTEWERYGSLHKGNREILIWASQVIEPLFEAKDDSWIAQEIGRRLGLEDALVNPLSKEQKFFNKLATSKVIKEDGSDYETLLTINQEDINALGVEGSPQTGRITLGDFKEKGLYQVSRKEGDHLTYVHNQAFREDPEKNPLDTASGKIELHCQALADSVTKAGWNTGSPIAKYDPPTEGYEATFSDWKHKIKGPYPLQVCSYHGRRQTHSNMGNVPWLRESFENNLLMNPVDAGLRGIKEQDTVRVYNDHGALLRRVHVTERVMAGVIMLAQGAWVDIDEDGNCRGGAANILTGDYASGPNIESWQACIAEVEKHHRSLDEDYMWPQRVVSV